MNGILIFVAVVVIMSAIGAVSRWLKNQQLEEQARLARERSGARARPDTGVDTIDRYVAEIERLRQRKAGQPADAPRAPARVLNPPVVKPVRRPRNPDASVPVVKPAARPRGVPRLEDLPLAPVIAPPTAEPRGPVVPVIVTPGASLFPQAAELAPSPIGPMTSSRPGVAARPEVARAKLTAVPPFLALLSSRQGLATAMAVSVVLGPPRCKRHSG